MKKSRRKEMFIQKQNKRCIQFGDLVRSYNELENRLKTMEGNFEKVSENDSENK